MTSLTAAGQMAASIAHEINQPLASIALGCSASLRWLAKKPPNLEEVKAALNRISDASDRASQVVGGIRAMFKNDSREKVLVDLNKMIREVIALLDAELQSHQILVEAELSPKLQPILADAVQLRQVIVNLVTNAIEAMDAVDDRTRTLRGEITASDPEGILITVEDTGPGIDPEDVDPYLPSVFSTTKSQGMGMGLYRLFADQLSRPIMGVSRRRPPLSPIGGSVFQIAFAERKWRGLPADEPALRHRSERGSAL